LLFWHDLTALLGGATVAEMQQRMDSREFARWMIWAKLRGGFGEGRADMRNGLLCALLVNIASGFGGKKGTAKPTDFLLFDENPHKRDPETVEQTKQQIEILSKVLKAKPG
jgi:hypothetical protein